MSSATFRFSVYTFLLALAGQIYFPGQFFFPNPGQIYFLKKIIIINNKKKILATSGYLEMTVSSVKDDFQMLKF